MKKLPFYLACLFLVCCVSKDQKKTPVSKANFQVVIDCDSICNDVIVVVPEKDVKLVETTNKVKKVLKRGEKTSRKKSKTNKYRFNVADAVTLIGKQRTKITILPNSFKYKDSEEVVKGEVKLIVKEYYKTSDVLLANLGTETKDGLLESRGMLHVTAMANGKECELIPGRSMKIDFPTQRFEEGFEYYRGIPSSNDESNFVWELVSSNQSTRSSFNGINPRQISSGNSKVNVNFMSYMYGGKENANHRTNVFSNWLVKEFVKGFKDEDLSTYKVIKRPFSRCGNAIRAGNNYRYSFVKELVFDFDTSKGNGILRSNVSRKSDYFVELKKMLRGVPSEVCSRGLVPKKKLRNNIIVSVNVRGGSNFDVEKFKREFDFSDNVAFYDYTTVYASNMSWINCDRFLDFKQEDLTDFIVDLGDFEQEEVKLIFKNYNAIMKGRLVDGKMVFKNIPINEEVTVVATKRLKGQSFFCFSEIKTDKEVALLDFKKFNQEEYLKKLQSLDKS